MFTFLIHANCDAEINRSTSRKRVSQFLIPSFLGGKRREETCKSTSAFYLTSASRESWTIQRRKVDSSNISSFV